MGIIQAVKSVHYVDTENHFRYTFEPIEESLTIKPTEDGFEVKYMTYDDHDGFNPNDDDDNGLFLVAYHRDFSVERKDFISRNECIALFIDNKKDDCYPKQIAKEYHVFGLEAYIHSGVALAISKEGNFCDRNWDVSQIGCVFASREEWKTRVKAKQAVLSLIKTWNYHLSGDVYSIVVEYFNKAKEHIDYDSCCGFYGYKETLKELPNFRM